MMFIYVMNVSIKLKKHLISIFILIYWHEWLWTFWFLAYLAGDFVFDCETGSSESFGKR